MFLVYLLQRYTKLSEVQKKNENFFCISDFICNFAAIHQ